MQTATETPLPQPQAITTPGPDGKPITITVPKSVEEVRDLVEHRRELSNQLTDVTNRRDQLARELQTAPPGVARTGLEERVRVLDQRILQLESDLARTGQQLAAAPSEYTSAVDFENRPRSTSDERPMPWRGARRRGSNGAWPLSPPAPTSSNTVAPMQKPPANEAPRW